MPPAGRTPDLDKNGRGVSRRAHHGGQHQGGCVVLSIRSIAAAPAALGRSLDLIRSPAKHRHLQYTRRYGALAPARRISWHVSDPVFIICSDDSRLGCRWSNAMMPTAVESRDSSTRAANAHRCALSHLGLGPHRRLGWRQWLLSADQIGGALRDHDGGRVGVATDDRGHDRGIDHSQAVDAMHPQRVVDRGGHIARHAHLAGADRVIANLECVPHPGIDLVLAAHAATREQLLAAIGIERLLRQDLGAAAGRRRGSPRGRADSAGS
jgi:hypothetical protein